MGVNSRFSDSPSEFTDRITQARKEHETALRERVRRGEITLETYLTKHKGLKPEHAAAMMPRFRKAIGI